jgi:hypothetical protein
VRFSGAIFWRDFLAPFSGALFWRDFPLFFPITLSYYHFLSPPYLPFCDIDSQEDPPIFEIRRSILTLRIRDFRQELKSCMEELGRAYKCVRYVIEQSHYSTFDAESDAKYL